MKCTTEMWNWPKQLLSAGTIHYFLLKKLKQYAINIHFGNVFILFSFLVDEIL